MNQALLTMWRIWDVIYFHCTRLKYVDKQNHNIFRVVVKKYRGKPLTVGEHTVVSPGDLYVKLHIYNFQLANDLRGVTGDTRLGLHALREVRQSLPALARLIVEDPNEARIKAVIGTTILYRGARPLGFHIQSIESTTFRWFKTFFFRLILSLCHPAGISRIRSGSSDKLMAKHVFMSKEALLQRYLGENR